MHKISQFRDQYAFLSNFHRHPFLYRDIEFPTAEHAFVMEKDGNLHRFILQCQGLRLKPFTLQDYLKLLPGQAKKFGRHIVLRENWDHIRTIKMLDILIAKFAVENLKMKLLQTGTAYLEEGNAWGDTFWGVCNGRGKNHLGKLLIKVRDYYNKDLPF
jgi:ribA/ribD-fused uncharacterized protein